MNFKIATWLKSPPAQWAGQPLRGWLSAPSCWQGSVNTWWLGSRVHFRRLGNAVFFPLVVQWYLLVSQFLTSSLAAQSDPRYLHWFFWLSWADSWVVSLWPLSVMSVCLAAFCCGVLSVWPSRVFYWRLHLMAVSCSTVQGLLSLLLAGQALTWHRSAPAKLAFCPNIHPRSGGSVSGQTPRTGGAQGTGPLCPAQGVSLASVRVCGSMFILALQNPKPFRIKTW